VTLSRFQDAPTSLSGAPSTKQGKPNADAEVTAATATIGTPGYRGRLGI